LAICFTASASSPSPHWCHRAGSADGASQRRAQFVCQVRQRILHDVEDLVLKPRAVVAVRDEVLDELVRKPNRFAHRHAEADEVFAVHSFQSAFGDARAT
jgi:hypothetical protein